MKMEEGEFLPIDRLVRLDQGAFNRRESIHLHYASRWPWPSSSCKQRDPPIVSRSLTTPRMPTVACSGVTRGNRSRNAWGEIDYEDLNKAFLEYLGRG